MPIGDGPWQPGYTYVYPPQVTYAPPPAQHHHYIPVPHCDICRWHPGATHVHADPLGAIFTALKEIKDALMTQSDDITADTTAITQNTSELAAVKQVLDDLRAQPGAIDPQVLARLDAAVAASTSATSDLANDATPPAPPVTDTPAS